MTYDDYDMMYDRLMYLKKNQNNLSLNERTKKVIEEIGEHPDAFEMYKGVFENVLYNSIIVISVRTVLIHSRLADLPSHLAEMEHSLFSHIHFQVEHV